MLSFIRVALVKVSHSAIEKRQREFGKQPQKQSASLTFSWTHLILRLILSLPTGKQQKSESFFPGWTWMPSSQRRLQALRETWSWVKSSDCPTYNALSHQAPVCFPDLCGSLERESRASRSELTTDIKETHWNWPHKYSFTPKVTQVHTKCQCSC